LAHVFVWQQTPNCILKVVVEWRSLFPWSWDWQLKTSQNNTVPVVVCCSANSGQITWYIADVSSFVKFFGLLWLTHFPRLTREMWQHCTALTAQNFPTTTMWKSMTFVEDAPPPPASRANHPVVTGVLHIWFLTQIRSPAVCVCLIIGLTGRRNC
jgi:hypothetical protein